MADKTKVFISSVAQDKLTRLRKDVAKTLDEISHQPEYFEETFDPWPSHYDPIEHCLNKVEECHVFLLFIANKAGFYVKGIGKTVTHLEFIRAHARKKVIQVFVEEETKHIYFSKVKWVIEDQIKAYKEVNDGRKPPDTTLYEIIQGLAGKKKSDVPDSTLYDPYVWLFLYDLIENKKIFCQDLSLGVSAAQWKDLFSDITRRGAILIPTSAEAKEKALLAESYGDFSDMVLSLMPKLKIDDIDDWGRFLTIARGRISGGQINQEYGHYGSGEPIVTLKNCSAIAVFRKDGEFMRLKESEGDTAKEGFFEVEDKTSFVSLTYKANSDDPYLWYQEDKNMVYLTWKVGEYVISYHFPEDGSLNQEKFIDFGEVILDGIINVEPNSLTFDFVKLIIGGMK